MSKVPSTSTRGMLRFTPYSSRQSSPAYDGLSSEEEGEVADIQPQQPQILPQDFAALSSMSPKWIAALRRVAKEHTALLLDQGPFQRTICDCCKEHLQEGHFLISADLWSIRCLRCWMERSFRLVSELVGEYGSEVLQPIGFRDVSIHGGDQAFFSKVLGLERRVVFLGWLDVVKIRLQHPANFMPRTEDQAAICAKVMADFKVELKERAAIAGTLYNKVHRHLILPPPLQSVDPKTSPAPSNMASPSPPPSRFRVTACQGCAEKFSNFALSAACRVCTGQFCGSSRTCRVILFKTAETPWTSRDKHFILWYIRKHFGGRVEDFSEFSAWLCDDKVDIDECLRKLLADPHVRRQHCQIGPDEDIASGLSLHICLECSEMLIVAELHGWWQRNVQVASESTPPFTDPEDVLSSDGSSDDFIDADEDDTWEAEDDMTFKNWGHLAAAPKPSPSPSPSEPTSGSMESSESSSVLLEMKEAEDSVLSDLEGADATSLDDWSSDADVQDP